MATKATTMTDPSHDPTAVRLRLKPCPPTPNCVCTLDVDARHAIEPLCFSGEPEAAMARLRRAIEGMKRTRIVVAEAEYLHAECRSLLFRFVDDLECAMEAGAGVIHIRSASRVGRSDFGVNRRRVERLRRAS